MQQAPMQGQQIPETGFDAMGQQAQRASPEEQRIYTRFVGLAGTLLYDDRFSERAIEMIRAEPTTMEGVAKVASLIAFQVYSEGKRQGQEIPADVVVHAGMEIITLVIEFALASGFEPMTDQEIELAHYGAADQFRDRMEAAGHIDPQQMQADRQQLQAMYDDGRLMQTLAAAQQMRTNTGGQP